MRLVQLLESPDKFTVGTTTVTPFQGNAFSFVTPNIIATCHKTHPHIFSVAKIFAGKGVGPVEKSQAGRFGIFADYHIEFLGGKPSKSELLAFAEKLVGEMGQARRNTQSGRVWIGIEDKDLGTLNGVSFWIDHADLMKHPNAAATVVGCFGLKGLTYIEAIDYKAPEIYGTDGPMLSTMRSNVAPELTKEQIYDILVKAHVSPSELSRRETEVAWEFRGKSSDVSNRVGAKHGYPTDAEWRHRRKFSESIASYRELTLPLNQ